MAIIENAQVDEEENEVLLSVRMDYDEFLSLEGHMKGIFLFAEKASKHSTTISRRGPGTTSYVLIPKPLRSGIPHILKDVRVNRLVTSTKDFIIFTIPKRLLG